jgi:hypothetical protein
MLGMGHYDALIVTDDIFCFEGEVGMLKHFFKSSMTEVYLIITTK